jgi:AraC-like DNA-binding protein
MHRDPARPWTVAALAQGSAMCRSAIAQGFTDLVGMPVLHDLMRWRMTLALDGLTQGLRIADVAAGAGYQSEAAFSRAFKRAVGQAPGAVRPGTLPRGDRAGASAGIAPAPGPGA